MEISNIPEDLTESQFRKFVIQVLEGLDTSVKAVSAQLNSMLSGELAELKQKIREFEAGQISQEEMAKFRSSTRRYWIGIAVSVILGVAGFVAGAMRH